MNDKRRNTAVRHGEDFPNGSVAFALAFEHAGGQGQFSVGQVAPGAANEYLADWLLKHKGSFSKILTQEAILVVLCEHFKAQIPPPHVEPALHIDGTDVHRMHRHDPKIPVHSLGSLIFSVDRLQDRALDSIVLLTHHAMFMRALIDLDFALRIRRPGSNATIWDPEVYSVPYANPNHLNSAMRWAWREQNRAAPGEFALRAMLKIPILRWLIFKKVCPNGVRLPPL